MFLPTVNLGWAVVWHSAASFWCSLRLKEVGCVEKTLVPDRDMRAVGRPIKARVQSAGSTYQAGVFLPQLLQDSPKPVSLTEVSDLSRKRRAILPSKLYE